MPREAKLEEDQVGVKRRRKLQSKLFGPYKVAESRSDTVVIDRDGLYETVSRDRIARAPSSAGENEPSLIDSGPVDGNHPPQMLENAGRSTFRGDNLGNPEEIVAAGVSRDEGRRR